MSRLEKQIHYWIDFLVDMISSQDFDFQSLIQWSLSSIILLLMLWYMNWICDFDFHFLFMKMSDQSFFWVNRTERRRQQTSPPEVGLFAWWRVGLFVWRPPRCPILGPIYRTLCLELQQTWSNPFGSCYDLLDQFCQKRVTIAQNICK